MSEILTFTDREEFRKWLSENCKSSEGVWLLFGKSGGPKTLKAEEAFEEVLCFGWIDGQMQSIDDKTYKKYFAERRAKSKWSDKNKAIVNSLEERGLMTDFGREKIEEAKKNGQWNAPDLMSLGEEAIAVLSSLLQGYEPAHEFSGYATIGKENLRPCILRRKDGRGQAKAACLDSGQAQ